MFKHGYCNSIDCKPSLYSPHFEGVQKKDVNLADIYLNKIKPDGTPIKKAIKKAPIKKDKKKMHCATKEMTIYERLDLLEKMLRCIPKLRKEVADLRKQVYGK
ncbi:MAG: hypothetical protein CL489_14580 [Acidobacteria bacterium]|nr:hypothetical protein [Acidobacteriota bacterium]|tara:strand:- start:593 stop:901 length:309 start_codon:yes stop_codon:yes gene_type:complete